jgi:S1-C subfamily serine protease
VELADVILGDVIVALNGHPVESDTQLMDLLELEPPETLLAFDVLRDGKAVRIVLRPGEARPQKGQTPKGGPEAGPLKPEAKPAPAP